MFRSSHPPGSCWPDSIRVRDRLYLLEAQLVRVQSDVEYVVDLEREVAAVRPHGGQSEHDDLVIAASLAAWQASRVHTELVRPRRVA